MSNLAKTFLVISLLYFGIHLIIGFSYCQDNFCPGDREADWVYEYTDDDGKRFVVVDGKPMSIEQYKELK